MNYPKSLLFIALFFSYSLTYAIPTKIVLQTTSGQVDSVIEYENSSISKSLKAKIYCGYKYIFSSLSCSIVNTQKEVSNPITQIEKAINPNITEAVSIFGSQRNPATTTNTTTSEPQTVTNIVQPTQVVYQVVERAVPGPQGPQGIQGPAGTTTIVTTQTQSAPTFYSNYTTGGQYYGTTGGSSITTISGAQGPAGARGVQGATGTSITSVTASGSIITIWYSNGATSTVTIPTISGTNGATGTGVSSIISSGLNLIFTYSNGSTTSVPMPSIPTTNSLSYSTTTNTITSNVNGVSTSTTISSLNNLNLTGTTTSSSILSTILNTITGIIQNLFFTNATGTNLTTQNLNLTNIQTGATTSSVLVLNPTTGQVEKVSSLNFVGATGSQGIQGPIGLTGATGTQGIQGIQGLTGATGTTGATGPQGPIGLTGPQGATGTQGIQGIQGLTGATGTAGTNGINGTTTNIYTIATSTSDITATNSATLATTTLTAGIQGAGLTSCNGIYQKLVYNSTLKVFECAIDQTSTGGSSTAVIAGNGIEVISTGATATVSLSPIATITSINATGTSNFNNLNITSATSTNFFSSILSALTGYIQNLFFTNATGTNLTTQNLNLTNIQTGATTSSVLVLNPTTGEVEKVSSLNFVGATGSQGIQGPIGLTGATGTQGIQGIQGLTGATGTTGATGPQGPIGLTGPQGATGTQGIQGIQGLTGATGTAGTNGINGTTTNIYTIATSTTDFLATGTATINNLIATNSTSTNFFSSILSALTGIIQNLFFTNATGSNLAIGNITATNTITANTINTNNITATNATFTNLSIPSSSVDNGLSVGTDTKVELGGILHKNTNIDQAGFNLTMTNGNVGVGTTSPDTNLRVIGTTKTDDFITKGPYVDVRYFGAKGDGVTDDTVAIQNVINSACIDKKKVFIPTGTFITTSTLNINCSDLSIEGSGYSSIIKFTGTTAGSVVLSVDGAATAGLTNIYINKLTLTGNNNSVAALFTRKVHHSTFENLRLRNVTYAALYSMFGVVNNYNNISISHNEAPFTVVPENGIMFESDGINGGVYASNIVNPIIEGVSGVGINLSTSANNVFTAGTSEGNGKGIVFGPGTNYNQVVSMDLEANLISDLEILGSNNLFETILSLGTTTIVSGEQNQIKGGKYNVFSINPAAKNTSVDSASLSLYGGAVSDNGIKTTMVNVKNTLTSNISNYNSGTFGIGTSTNLSLEIVNPTAVITKYFEEDSGKSLYQVLDGGVYDFRPNSLSSSSLSINLTSGNVGIGTTNPSNKLEITKGVADQSGLRFTNLTSASTVSASNGKTLSVDSNGDVILVSAGAASIPADLSLGTLVVSSSTAPKVATFNGDIDVTGTIDPTRILFTNLAGVNSPTYNPSANGNNYSMRFEEGGNLNFQSNTTNNILHLANNGNVGIGTSTPDTNLRVIGTTKTDDFITKGPYVDVRYFGAKGDGVTDDTAAIQAAIIYAESQVTLSPSGSGQSYHEATHGTVYIPSGSYLVSGIDIRKPIKVFGDGIINTKIYLKSGSNRSVIKMYGPTFPGDFYMSERLEKMAIFGNRLNQSGLNNHGIEVVDSPFSLSSVSDYASGVQISEIQVSNLNGHGIYIGDNRNDNVLKEISISTSDLDGLHFAGISYDTRMENSNIGINKQGGIRITNGGGHTFSQVNVFYSEGQPAVKVDNSNAYIYFWGCDISQNDRGGMEILNSSTVVGISDSAINNNSRLSSGTFPAIKVRNSKVSISSVHFMKNPVSISSYLVDNDNTSIISFSGSTFDQGSNKPYTIAPFASQVGINGIATTNLDSATVENTIYNKTNISSSIYIDNNILNIGNQNNSRSASHGVFAGSDLNYRSGVQGYYDNSGSPVAYDYLLNPLGGNVAIGNTAPTTKLQVSGDIRVGTTGTNGCLQRYDGTALAGTCSSDENLKSNIKTLDNADIATKLSQVDIVEYNWNETANKEYSKATNTKAVGITAQNVEEVFPELVSTDDKGFKVVDITTLQWYVMAAVKQLIDVISKMAEEVVTKMLRAELLCVGDASDSECINKDELRSLKRNGNISPTIQSLESTAPTNIDWSNPSTENEVATSTGNTATESDVANMSTTTTDSTSETPVDTPVTNVSDVTQPTAEAPAVDPTATSTSI